MTTVAGPRIPFPRETYSGAELATRSSRPGAYDALVLPSLFNGKPRAPGPMPEPLALPGVPPPCSVRPNVVANDAPALPPLPVEAASGSSAIESAPALDINTAEAELETRKATLELWQSYVSHLQARMAFDALARRMRPLIPPHNMPAL